MPFKVQALLRIRATSATRPPAAPHSSFNRFSCIGTHIRSGAIARHDRFAANEIITSMKRLFGKSAGSRSIALLCVFVFFLVVRSSGNAAELKKARVSQVIQDVRLLGSNAAPRPAAVNDSIGEGTAVRTGTASRAELTFADLTITRLGENTVFSFSAGTRELNLSSGAVLVEVPPKGAAVKIKTPAVTAAISGGTALFSKGPPAKFMVLEGTGTFYPTGHPEEAVTLHGGEMVMMTANGHITQSTKFNVQLVLSTSHLIVDFPELTNLPLILDVMNQQLAAQSTASSSPPPKNIIDIISQNTTANPAVVTFTATPAPTGTPSEFGSPPTISTPDPYVINSGTSIVTDLSITTNGVTNFGTFYHGTALDGTPSQFLFGQAPTSFDQMVFSGAQNNLPIAVFKFADLELAGDPTITVPSGGATNLALVSVGTITSGAPGGTLTFAGIQRLDFITQNGSINLGSEIAFSGIDHLTFYARGSGSNLTLASPISGGSVVHLYSGGTVQVNGSVTVSDTFSSLSGGDFLAGTGPITATNINIQSLNNININASQFPNPTDNTGSVALNATNTLNLNLDRGGGFGWSSLDASGGTINITGENSFDFSNATGGVIFAAGTGGINASNINFVGSNLTLTSGGNISVGSFESPSNGHGGNIAGGTISAAGAVNATGNITNVSDLTAGTSVSIGGDVGASNITAGTTINVGGQLFADDVTAGGNITANGVGVITINAPTSVLTAGSGGIFAEVTDAGAGLQNTFNIDSIISPAGIDFSGNQFNGINGLSSGGLLTINARTITFDSEVGVGNTDFNGADSGAFGSGNPAEGGDGGTLIVNTTGDIIVSGANITATTGLNSGSGVFSGAGGNVTLDSSGGSVTVDQRIEVSSDDPSAPRQSASGGNITLHTDLTTGPGITIGQTASLLSLLDASAPGPGGSITLSTFGADINILGGTIEADRGTITISQGDPVNQTPMINIDGATLTSEILSISGAGDVNIGVNSPVTLNVVTLSISATDNLNWSGGTLSATATNSDGDVNIFAGNQISITNALEIDRKFGGSPTGLNVSFTAGNNFVAANGLTVMVDNSITGNLSAGANIALTSGGGITTNAGGLSFTLQNTGGSIGAGGNITVSAAGALSTQALSLVLQNYDESANPAGHIGTGGNIAVTTGGDLTANSVDLFIGNRGGGTIGSGGNLTLNVNGALTTTGDAGFIIETRFDNSANGSSVGSSIGSSVTLQVSAASVNVGGSLSGTFFNAGSPASGISNVGSTINGNVTYEWNVSGAMTIGGAAPFFLLNDGGSNIFSPISGTIHGNALLQVTAGSLTASGFVDAFSNVYPAIDAEINNRNGGVIDGNATINFNVTGDITANNGANAPGDAFFLIRNQQNASGTAGGSIGGAAMLSISAADVSVAGDFDAEIQNQRGASAPGPSGGSIGTDATLSVTATSLSVGGELDAVINNQNNGSGSGTGGSIQGNAAINITLSGGLTTTGSDSNSSGVPGDANFVILNANLVGGSGGFIGSDATINVNAASISTSGSFDGEIDNNGGTIGGRANVGLDVSGDVTVSGANGITLQILNEGGSIGGGMPGDGVSYTVGGTTSTPSLALYVDNSNRGVINAGGSAILNTTGPVMLNGPLGMEVDNFNGGSITNGANVTAHFVGDVTDTVGQFHSLNFFVLNGAGFFSSDVTGGTIGTGGNINVTFDGNAETTPTSTTGSFAAVIANGGGVIGTGGNISLTVGGNVVAGGQGFNVDIENQAGQITNGGNVTVQVAGDVTSTTGAFFGILNNGGSIGDSVTVQIGTTGNITADSLTVLIDNTGGSIGGDATINMNVGGTATVTNNATVQILGNDPAGSAAINFNGGSYTVGGTFLSTIDGNGAIKFANANISADTIKAAVFGSNGTLMISGGTLSANTLMKLYATGSSGTIDFTANVTLTCKAAALILAANTITINDNVVVTIAGSFQASVYANIANYSGSGGNGTTTGTFAGAGASNPQSLGNAPPFSASATSATKSSASGSTTVASATASSSTKSQSSSGTHVASSSNVNAASGGARQSPSQSDVSLAAARKATSGKATTSSTINLSNSAELLSLLDAAAPGPSGKVTVRASKSTSNSRNSSRINAGSRVKSDRADIQGGVKKPVLLSSAPSFHRAAF